MELISVLATTKELLLRSELITPEIPMGIANTLDQVISHLLCPSKNSLPDEDFECLFFITGVIEDIAYYNGWLDEFFSLSLQFSHLFNLVLKKH